MWPWPCHWVCMHLHINMANWIPNHMITKMRGLLKYYMSSQSSFKIFKRTEPFFVMLMWYYNFPSGKLKICICNVVVLTEFCRINCMVRGFHVADSGPDFFFSMAWREAPEDGRRDCRQKGHGWIIGTMCQRGLSHTIGSLPAHSCVSFIICCARWIQRFNIKKKPLGI